MSELIACGGVIFCSITYYLGGQEIPWTHTGYKWIRRYLLPAGLCFFIIASGTAYLNAILSCAILSIALHVGYGSSLKRYFGAGFLMGLPVLLLYVHPDGLRWIAIGLPLVPAITHTFFGWLSIKFNRFKWGYVSLIQGLTLGLIYLF